MDKIAVFIEGGMLSILTKSVFPNADGTPRKLPLKEFPKVLAKECGGELFRTYYYICPPYQSQYPNTDERRRKQSYDKFAYALRQLKQFQLREGRLRKYYDEQGKPDFVQKGVDVLLAVDMLKLALKGAIQKAILVSSDSDFVPVVRALRDEGVFVILYYYKSEDGRNQCFSQDLYEECDDRIQLTLDHFTTTENP